MTQTALSIAFCQLLYPWFANSIVARSVQLTLIFHLVTSETPSAWVSVMLASGATASALMTVPVGRLFNHLGSGPINRIATGFTLLATLGLYILPHDFEHIYCAMAIWIIAGQSMLFTTIASYRGMGALFIGQARVVAFARMNIVSNLSDIVTPIAIGWLFFVNDQWIPFVIATLAITNFFVPQPKMPMLTSTKTVAGFSLLRNIKNVLVTRPVYLAILIGAAIHSLLFIFDLIIPLTGNGLNLTTKEVGAILSSLALSQALASAYLSFRPITSETLFDRFINGLCVGSCALLFAVVTHNFFSLLALTLVIGLGFGLIQPLSMSLIYHHTDLAAVGDAVSIRLFLNSLGRICAPMVLACALHYTSPTTFSSIMGVLILGVVAIVKMTEKRG